MSRAYILPFTFAVLLHGGIALSSYIEPPHKAVAHVRKEPGVVVVALPPADEPDAIEDSPVDAPKEVAVNAPPQLVDVPGTVVDLGFTQALQPQVPVPSISTKFVVPLGAPVGTSTGKSLGKVFDLASVDQQPEVRSKVNPVYPRELARTRLTGEVLVGFVVDTKGNVSDPYIVKSSHAGFEDAVLQAVVKWKFKPGRKGGAAVNTRVELPLSFSLDA